ncbi:hypothetical protein KKC91_06960 [bacterium]|nr:hypothetical protein [bacterium]
MWNKFKLLGIMFIIAAFLAGFYTINTFYRDIDLKKNIKSSKVELFALKKSMERIRTLPKAEKGKSIDVLFNELCKELSQFCELLKINYGLQAVGSVVKDVGKKKFTETKVQEERVPTLDYVVNSELPGVKKLGLQFTYEITRGNIISSTYILEILQKYPVLIKELRIISGKYILNFDLYGLEKLSIILGG